MFNFKFKKPQRQFLFEVNFSSKSVSENDLKFLSLNTRTFSLISDCGRSSTFKMQFLLDDGGKVLSILDQLSGDRNFSCTLLTFTSTGNTSYEKKWERVNIVDMYGMELDYVGQENVFIVVKFVAEN